MCDGSESSISQCSYNPLASPECYSAAVTCTEGTTLCVTVMRVLYYRIFLPYCLACDEGSVRFIDRTFTFIDGQEAVSGVVQVCVNQRYGYVCADNWDNREAEVVCRSYRSYYQGPNFGMLYLFLLRYISLFIPSLSHRECSLNNIYDP